MRPQLSALGLLLSMTGACGVDSSEKERIGGVFDSGGSSDRGDIAGDTGDDSSEDEHAPTPVSSVETGPFDSDGDCIPDVIELGPWGPQDADGDGLPNHLDADSDGNGLDDGEEAGCSGRLDSDRDGTPDHLDLDDDNDTIYDVEDGMDDFDGDGEVDRLDRDADEDCIPDRYEAGDSDLDTPPLDTDGDGKFDHVDIDADGDGLRDTVEVEGECDPPRDLDGDRTADHIDPDTDGDGLDDHLEGTLGTDFRDRDSDDDGFTDGLEEFANTDPLSADDYPLGTIIEVEARDRTEGTAEYEFETDKVDIFLLVDTAYSYSCWHPDIPTFVDQLVTELFARYENMALLFSMDHGATGAARQPSLARIRVSVQSLVRGRPNRLHQWGLGFIGRIATLLDPNRLIQGPDESLGIVRNPTKADVAADTFTSRPPCGTRWLGFGCLPLLIMSSAGCTQPASQKTDSAPGDSAAPPGDSAAPDLDFSILADEIPQGVLLSAWTDSSELLMVGGELGRTGILARYDGTRLCVEEDVADGALWWIHGPRDGEWYAVGESGIIVHNVDGERTHEDVDTDATLFGVYSMGERVWAVGGNVASLTGEIWLREGGTWSLFAQDLPGLMFKTWEGWFIGDGQAYRLNDVDELVSYDVGGARLVTVRGWEADSDAWAVGGSTGAVLVHFDGHAWEEVDQSLGQPLNGVWTATDKALYVAGNSGLAAFYQDGEWVQPEVSLTAEVLHAVWPFGDEVFWVGGNLLTSSGVYHGTILRYGEQHDVLTPEACL